MEDFVNQLTRFSSAWKEACYYDMLSSMENKQRLEKFMHIKFRSQRHLRLSGEYTSQDKGIRHKQRKTDKYGNILPQWSLLTGIEERKRTPTQHENTVDFLSEFYSVENFQNEDETTPCLDDMAFILVINLISMLNPKCERIDIPAEPTHTPNYGGYSRKVGNTYQHLLKRSRS